MNFRLISNIIEFKGVENEWQSLYEMDKENTVFQSFEFNYFSWIYNLVNAKNTLAIVIAYDSDKIKAIFPFYIDKRCRLRFINDLHADFCDSVSIDSVNFSEIILFLKSSFKIYYFHLVNIKKESSLLDYSNISSSNVISDVDYSVLNLNKGTFPNNCLNYKSKQKTEFRRILKLNKDKDYKIIDHTNTVFPKFQIEILRKKMILLGIRDKNFLSNSQLLLIEELYLSGKLVLSVVSKSGSIKAISFLITSKSEYLFWIDMYDDSKMINLFNYILAISSLSAKNSVKINFGRGSYNYKIKNFLPLEKNLFSLYIFSSKYIEFKFFFKRRVIQLMRRVYNKINFIFL